MFDGSKAFSSFSVNNLQQAKGFYGNTLGLKVKELEMGLLELNLDQGFRVIIYEKKDHRAAGFTILNFEVVKIESAVKELKARGVKFEQYEDPVATNEEGICDNGYGPKIAWFKDPFGNILSILEDGKQDEEEKKDND
ncbi:VOC family protein [Antarcticibacterium flavum]|uniref:VOC family protein n=1 Tax=Antarcticibacterium flavum TaxID=2058175 RepID=A0A5B7X0P7_9FLAO|nr:MULTISPECIES: VOC family protein [Antarcticibacterium]MCM4158925.1 glyoxalase [Antarcticibacterium sp. W02-3]QCY68181.1 VOC family protein [Antarcticibacterium flavum]